VAIISSGSTFTGVAYMDLSLICVRSSVLVNSGLLPVTPKCTLLQLTAPSLGFGSYLHSLDASRDWREHLQFTLIYCAVHFARGIQQKFGNLEARPLMLALLTEQNQQHIDRILHTLTNHHKPAVRQWVRHKKIPWIFSGINPIATKMRRDVFISQQRSSNLVESTHANTDRTGTGLSLLTAIIRYIHNSTGSHLQLVPDGTTHSASVHIANRKYLIQCPSN